MDTTKQITKMTAKELDKAIDDIAAQHGTVFEYLMDPRWEPLAEERQNRIMVANAILEGMYARLCGLVSQDDRERIEREMAAAAYKAARVLPEDD